MAAMNASGQATAAGSDSDSNSEDAPEYYQPISAVGDEDSDLDNSDEDHASGFHDLSNGYCNEISSLRINDDSEQRNSEDEDEDEEESNSAIRRAMREDENRRNAPLTAENATRVMEAMRGVSFGGLAPDWADRISEDRWIDQLRRLRQPPSATNGA